MTTEPLPFLLAALCEALTGDLEIEEMSLLLLVAHKKGVPARSVVGPTYRRPREGLRKAGLIEWREGMLILTLTGRNLVERILAAGAKTQSAEVAA